MQRANTPISIFLFPTNAVNIRNLEKQKEKEWEATKGPRPNRENQTTATRKRRLCPIVGDREGS
jgi:hypothetical protein